MAHRLAEHGIELYYHTHHLEFQKFDGEYLLDIIKNNTTKLGFELDVHWIQRAGVNPVEFVKAIHRPYFFITFKRLSNRTNGFK